jgi:iron complex outermembrane receptor protein
MQKYILSILLFLIISVFTANAQNGNIRGKVSTQDGKPAAFVSIILKNINKGTSSDENGTFLIKNVKEGSYTVITQFVGLQSQEKEVTVIAGQTVNLDFILAENAQQLSEVTVTEYRSANEKNVTIGKVAIRPMDLPQSVMVIGKEVLERQQTLTMGDALMNVNGVYLMGTTGGTQQEIAGRGFSFGSSNTFKNGTRYNNGILPEMSSLEKVEVMKGSSAILFGNVSAGGVINLVTKKPQFKNGGEVSFRAGSYDFYKPIIDVYGAINNSEIAAYRINTSYEKAGSYREGVTSERFYINPSFLLKAGKKTEILLEGDLLRDNRTQDYGTVAINYEIADIPRNRFLGAAWSYFKAEQQSVNATVTHHLNSQWQLRSQLSYQAYTTDGFGTTRPNTSNNTVKANGNLVRGVQRSKVSEDYYLANIDLIGQFSTGFLKHNLLVGIETDKYDTRTTAFITQTTYDSVNVYNPYLIKQRNDIPDLAVNTFTNALISRGGGYVQDLIGITDYIKLLAGVRYTYQQTLSNVLTYSTGKTASTLRLDDAFTPRLGLVIQPMRTMSVFASYANSFNVNSGTDNTGNGLPPSFLNQYEIGVKNELFNGKVSANITAYKIVNSNLAQTILANSPDYKKDYPNAQELAGEVTSKGLEIDIMTKPVKGFSIMAGYSYNETKYTESNIYIVGSKLRYNPAHTANCSIYYAFDKESLLKGFNLGVTVFYTGERFAGRSTRLTVNNDAFKLMRLPDFAQFDVSAGYVISKFSVRVKVSNLTNVLSYYVHDDNSVNPLAPRLVSGTVSYKF